MRLCFPSISGTSGNAEKAVSNASSGGTTHRGDWSLEGLEPKVLMSGDLIAGVHLVEGAIDQPGEQDTFEFVVQDSTRFYFDGVQGASISWSPLERVPIYLSSRDLQGLGSRAPVRSRHLPSHGGR
ncbi:MAG: LEPR-XLL domain-containing protein [Uliginosibacterium sp.]|nr:LEPR-XLL domain-containing protein [Uliginosibacterium sp.]